MNRLPQQRLPQAGRPVLLTSVSALLAILALPPSVSADQTIGDGATTTLGDGDVQDMNCQAVTISPGGKLDTSAGGTLQEVTTLTIEGELDGGSGSILKLSNWVNNGTVTSVPSTLEFAEDCGPISVAGTSDTDGDGIIDDLEGGTDTNDDTLSDLDVDNDGIYNFLDDDSDGDGKLDSIEGTGDADSDGIPNYLDPLDIDPSSLIINEIDVDTPDTDVAEFVELYDGGAGNTPLDGLVAVLYTGTDDTSYAVYSLNGQTTDVNGYFTLCSDATQVANCTLDVLPDSDLLQQDASAVALYQGSIADFPNGTTVTTDNLIDALVYDTADADDPELLTLLNVGQSQVDEDANGNKTDRSIQLCPVGTKTQRNTDGYVLGSPTPGAANNCDLTVDLQLTASADKVNPAPGETVTFSVNLQNAGPSDATYIAVQVNLPNGLMYAGDDAGVNYNSGTGVWTVDSLAKDVVTTLTLTATVQAAGSYVFSAEVTTVDQMDINSDPTLSFADDDLADGMADNDEVRFSVMDVDDDGIPDDVDIDNDNDGILDADEGTGDADEDGIPDNLDRDSDNDGIPDLNEQVCGWSEGRWVLGEADGDDKVRIATYQHPQGVVVAELGDGMAIGTLRSHNTFAPHEYPALFGASDPTIEGRSILGIGSGSVGANNGTAITLDVAGFTALTDLTFGFENLGGGTVSNPYRYRMQVLDAADAPLDMTTMNLIGTEYALQTGGHPISGPYDEQFVFDAASGDITVVATGANSNNSLAAFWNGLPVGAAKIRLSILDATAGYGDSLRVYLGTDGSNSVCTDDPDGDTLPNYKDPDSDDDGISDNVEAQTTADFIAPGTDDDGDSLIDTYAEKDEDGEWISYGLDPVSVDTDADGVADYVDPDSDGDGIPDADEGEDDVDSDNIPNFRDLDADGDGIPDNIEGQTIGGFAVPTGADTDNNGIDDAYGDGLEPVDTDVDGVPDYLDTNSDNSGADDLVEAELALDNADADGDGLDDAIDTDDGVFGPAHAEITNPLIDYPLSSGDPAWRKANAAPAFITAETYHIESGQDFGRMLFKINPFTGEKTEIGEVPYSTTGMAYDAASGTLYILSNSGELAAWQTSQPYALTEIGSLEDPTWSNPLPDTVSYQTGSFYDGSLYFVPTYKPNTDPASMQDDLYRIDFTDPMTPANIVLAANMSGDTVTWNGNADISIDPETGILYGRSQTLHLADDERTSYLYSYNLMTQAFNVIQQETLPYDFSNRPAPSVKTNFSGIGIGMEIFDGQIYGASTTGQIYHVDPETGDAEIIAGYIHNDADGAVGGDWAGGMFTKLNSDSIDYNENDTAAVIDMASTDDNDAENNGLTYSLEGGSDDAAFAIDPATGEITFKSVPDFEAPTDAEPDNVYEVGVKVCDSLNACSTTSLTINVLDVDEDRDNDGLLDSIEATLGTDPEDDDTDGDGLTDGMEAGGADNDPATTADNINTDPLDADSDDDGLSDGAELSGVDGKPATGTDPNLADTDGDGLQDGTELGLTAPIAGGESEGSNPVNYVGTDLTVQVIDADPLTMTDPLKADTDEGGVCDGANAVDTVCEAGEDLNNNGKVDDGETDPNFRADEVDTDSDGLTDAVEADLGTDPEVADTDNDGINDGDEAGGADKDLTTTADNTNPLDPDTDGDGIHDGHEVGGDPRNPIDSDLDGTADVSDMDDDNDGLLTKFEAPDANGDGDPADAQNTDIDGKPDYLDVDDDGDGKITSNERADDNGDGNPADAYDMDGDGIPNYLDDTEVPTLHLHMRGILQGPYADDGLMQDDLRTKALLPIAHPYADTVESFGHLGSETTASSLLDVTGNDAIVDWVLVELRSASDVKHRVVSQAALLQRDGDVVDAVTGSDRIAFTDMAEGDFYVTLRHRNHLGVMTGSPVSLTPLPVMVDFSLPGTAVYGDHARLSGEDVAVMWAGESNLSNSVIGNGPGNDVRVVFGRVLGSPANETVNSNFRLKGYYQTDFNLDGVTLFAGPDNDINLLMGNVLLHPENGSFSANFVVQGQLPLPRLNTAK